MARSEKALWKNLKGKLPTGSYQRHEDKLGLGIPDLSYSFRHKQRAYSGWIELKEAEPERRKVVKVGLQPSQRHWLMDRGMHGGECWLLVQLDFYYWYRWSDLVNDVNNLTLSQHKKRAHHWGELSAEVVLKVLTGKFRN